MRVRRPTPELSAQEVLGRVLREAANAERFFDYSDAERLMWMLHHAYTLGQSVRSHRKRQH